MPFLASLGELSDKFSLLGVDADHGIAGDEELPHQGVDVPELVIPVRVLATLHRLTGALEAVAQSMEELRNGTVTGMTHLCQCRGEMAC
jgi:hypothetical protein